MHVKKDSTAFTGSKARKQVRKIQKSPLEGVNVPLKSKSWRYWRLTEDEFNNSLRPYLGRWSEVSIECLFQVVVKGDLQKNVAAKYGKTPMAVHNVLKRGLKIYFQAKNINSDNAANLFKDEE